MKFKKKKFSFWIIVAIIFITILIKQEFTIYRLKKQYKVLTQNLKIVNMKKVEIDEEITMSKTDRYIQSLAREKLRLIAPDEILFIDKARINKLSN